MNITKYIKRANRVSASNPNALKLHSNLNRSVPSPSKCPLLYPQNHTLQVWNGYIATYLEKCQSAI